MSWDGSDPASQNRTVTVEFLNELYDKADELVRLRRLARDFGEHVLFCDSYGCENGPGSCLHASAREFLTTIG